VTLLKLALAGIRARPTRSALVVFAIALGVGILGGTLVYGDTARAAFFDDLARGARGIDVVAQPAGDNSASVAEAEAALGALPEVAHVDRRVNATIGVIGRNGRVLLNAGRPGLAMLAPTWAGFAPYDVVAGRAPSAAGEIAIDAPTADREGLALGDTVRIADRDAAVHQLTLVGRVDFGVSKDYADRSIAVLTADDLARFATLDGAPVLVIAGRGSLDRPALAQRVADVVGSGYAVTTGDELRLQLATEAAKYVSSFQKTLWVAAIVAVAATALVVYNTFQIVAAQRRREFALLRCVGTGRGQLVRLVLLESALLGLAGAVGAIGAGVLAGLVLAMGQDVFGSGLPSFKLVVQPSPIVISAAVALIATVVSAVIPSLAAGRTAPVAALRDATSPRRRRRVPAIGAVLFATALAAAGLYLMRSGHSRGFDGLPALVGGGMAIFVAITVTLPFFIGGLSAPLRRLLASVMGTPGRLAADNAARHPLRSAATTASLVVALAPMATLAVLLTTARAQAVRELAENFPVDYVVSDASGAARPFGTEMVRNLRADPAFGVVAVGRSVSAHANGAGASVGAIDSGGLALEVREGDPGGLPEGTVAVRQRFALDNGLAVGDDLALSIRDAAWHGRIVALYDNSPLDVDVLASWNDLAAHDDVGEQLLLIRRADGVSAADATRALDRALEQHPYAGVASIADRREQLTESWARRLTQFNVLFAISVVIGLVGIVNALYLAVAERRSESALLRAVGLSRRQLYGMLVIEAEISAVIGSVIGIAFGVGLGWIAARQLIEFYGHGSPSIPVTTIASYGVVAALGAALAALVPGRRAARSAPIDAMQDA
jgi:putative ABC transport system permease protein